MKTTKNRQHDTTVTPPQPEKLIGRDELADLLGINKRTLDRYRSAGVIPAPTMTIGKMPRWSLTDIGSWQSGARGLALSAPGSKHGEQDRGDDGRAGLRRADEQAGR